MLRIRCRAERCAERCAECRALGESGERYKQTYNLKTGVVRSCELRYDMPPGSTTPRATGYTAENRAVWVSMKPPKVTAHEALQRMAPASKWLNMFCIVYSD